MRKNAIQAREIDEAMAHYMSSLIASRDFNGAVKYYEENRSQLDGADGPALALILRHAATAYASLADYPNALRLARMSQTMSTNLGESHDLAETFVVIGGILRNMEEFKEAEKAFRDAESIFRRHDCPEGQSRALNLLAGLFYRRGEYKSALPILMDAISIAKRLDDKHKLAYMMGNIGRIYTFVGDFKEAKEYLKLNIKLSRELDDSVELTRAHLALGLIHIKESDFTEAERQLDEAYRLLVQCQNVHDEVIYLNYLGELRYRSGKLQKAREILARAVSQAENVASGSVLAGRAMRHLAEVLVLLGNHRAAQRYAASAQVIMDQAGEQTESGALWQIRARIAERLGNPDEARSLFLKALDVLGEAGVRFETADALTQAGKSSVFGVRQRLTYLFRAEEFYRRNSIDTKLDEIERLIATTGQPLDLAPEIATTVEQHDGDIDFLTNCQELIRIKKQLPGIARRDLPILLTGETGVGKDRMARYYHATSRPGKPFVAVNCAAIPEALLESELFGYHRGAFTGADQDKEGRFLAANGGVLFLDEIGDMPLTLQTKLLGVLESRKIVPVGSTTEVDLDVRLVFATNQDLKEMVDRGRFRQDLYYRISVLNFRIPPLRERREDIPLLLSHFLEHSNLQSDSELPAELVHQFVRFDWPGNVRQLLNKVRKLEVMAELVAEGELVELSRSIFAAEEATVLGSLTDRVEQFERQLIEEALLATRGNKSAAARILGIHEATVRTKLKRYGIRQEGGAVN